MAKGEYIGVSGKAKKVKKIYIGVGGKAKKVKKAYIGVGGKAKLFFTSGLDTNKMMLLANNKSTSNANVYEVNTDTGVATLKSNSYTYSQILYDYGARWYDNVNNRFASSGYTSTDFGVTWTQDRSVGYLCYKGHQLSANIYSSSTQSQTSGVYASIDGTNIYLGQYTYVTGGSMSFAGIVPYSDTEVIYMFNDSWTYPSSHYNYNAHAFLVNIETKTATNIHTVYNPSPYEFGNQPYMEVIPSLTDLTTNRFVVKYRDTHQNSEESYFHVGLAYLSTESGNLVMRKVPNTTPSNASLTPTYEREMYLGNGARTEDAIITLQNFYQRSYYLSTNAGNTWTVVTHPSITQGNYIFKVYATGEKFLALLGSYNSSNNQVRILALLKSTNGSTWTLVCEVPERGTGSYDRYVYGILPILIGSYYKCET